MSISKYKNTSVGVIPIDWEVKKIKEIGDVSSGGTPDTTKAQYWDGNINWCTPTDITALKNKYLGDTKTKITAEGLKSSSAKILPPFSIIVCTRATIGKAAINTVPMSTNQGFKNIIPKNVDVDFLFYKIISEEKGLFKIACGSTFLEVSKTDFDNFHIAVPPLLEQQKISSILSTWDVAIDNYKEIIDNLKNRNIGLAQQLLLGKMRLKGFEKSQWHLKSVEEVAVFKNGKAHENCIDEEGAYFVVNSKFISTQGKVAKASNENLCPLFKNDITMVMSDIPNGKAFAKCFYIPEDDKYTLNQRICALTAKKGTDSKFLYYQMNRNNYYLAFNNGVSQTNLKKEEVIECPLLMPDIEEQIQIVKLIDTANEELNQYQQKLETLLLQKKGLMQQLLTGKVRVKI
jgi:type I restriction enzyme S subunit